MSAEKPNAERLLREENHRRWVACGSQHEGEARCPECDTAAKRAYSDATTPGFFSPKCSKHREPSAVGQPSLEKLRELEAKWRKQDDTNGGICPNDEASCCHAWCADELRAVLAAFEKEGK